MIAFVTKKGCNTGGRGGSIVVSEFGKGKDSGPVILLVVAEDSEVLFQSLVKAFGLTIAFRVITRGEVNLHIQGNSQGMEEVGSELRAPITSNMCGNSVFAENMNNKEFSEFGC